MSWANWIPAGVVAAVLAGLGWLLRVPITKGMERAIAATFDEKLERLRSELRDRGAEIDALRSGAFVNFSARQAELARRRIVAVEVVWAEVSELRKYKYLSSVMERLNVDEIIESTSKSANDRKKMSEFAAKLLGNLADPKAAPRESTAYKERLFVPELTFALFLAYQQIVVWPYMFLLACRMEGDLKLLKTEPLVEVTRKALPGYGKFLDEHGISGVPLLVDDVEAALLASLREALDQKDADAAAVAQAQSLIEAVKASTPKPKPVDPPKLGG